MSDPRSEIDTELTDEVRRVIAVWGLSTAETARLFGVTGQTVARWLASGPPNGRAPAIAELAAITDVLHHFLASDRIPAVVRQRAPALRGRSVMELVELGKAHDALDGVRAMFRFGDLQAR